MICAQCGHENIPGANFCSNCGAALRSSEEPETTMIFASSDPDAARSDLHIELGDLGPDQAMLVVKRGPNAGTKYVVASDRVTIGRHPESEFFLDDVTVSRRHAEVRHEPEGFSIKDVGSLNGTYLNGDRVEAAPLQSGDELRIGKYVITFMQA